MSKRDQINGVRRLVRENVDAVARLEPAAVRPTLEVLIEARKELRAALQKWMHTVKDPTERFTGHQMRVMLHSLEAPINTLGIRLKDMTEPGRHPYASALDRSMLAGLKKGTHATGILAAKNIESEIVRLGHVFGQSLIAPQLDIAAVLSRGNELLFRKTALPSSAARYAGKVGEDLRMQLAVGVARGETFEQMVQRLRRLGGPTGPVAVRGIFGNPSAIIEDIPEGLFARYKHFADRIVRTEMMGAYNAQHREATKILNEERPRGAPKWLRKCDESMDSRTCTECKGHQGEIIKQNAGGPPWHPNCRGVELAWLEDWDNPAGASSDATTAAEQPPPSDQAPKNPKRVEAARKAGEASAERRREIHSAVKSNLSPDLHVAWDKEGHKYMRQEARRIKGIDDPINAASKISEAFTETYGSGEATAHGNEGDRYFKRAQLEAEHAETWANEQERKYYEEMARAARAEGAIDEHGELTSQGRSKLEREYTAKPSNTSGDDPPF